MVTDKATSVTISDILASACGDLRPAMTAVAQLANQELVPGGTNDQVEFSHFGPDECKVKSETRWSRTGLLKMLTGQVDMLMLPS